MLSLHCDACASNWNSKQPVWINQTKTEFSTLFVPIFASKTSLYSISKIKAEMVNLETENRNKDSDPDRQDRYFVWSK